MSIDWSIPFSSRVVSLLVNDIDTDQIIPARYLKATGKEGMGDYLFADWRLRGDGTPDPDFVLNRPESRNAGILLAGNNFGCGSSREHAAWALLGFGFRVVISTSFADIFRSNALKNGLLPVQLELKEYSRVVEHGRRTPSSSVTIDLRAQTVSLPDGERLQFPIDAFSKYCLLNGVDELGYLLRFEERIEEFERTNR